PAEGLAVADGVVAVKSNPAKHISYGELIGGRRFNVELEWNQKYGNSLDVKGKATPKTFAEYKIVGQSHPRNDIAAKVFARFDYVTDVKVPGMLHARMIRPPVVGSVPAAVDQSSIKDIPGARVVWKEGFLGVVAEKEWNAIRAAQALKVTWSQVQPPFPDQSALYDFIRQAPARKHVDHVKIGDADAALTGAAKTITADYEWPFQSHSSMGPACAVVAIKNGAVTVWTGSQKPHYARDGVAAMLKLDPAKVRAIWVAGPGSYGRNDAGDAAIDAAILARELGRPVRVQGMRADGHAWDPKGPASVYRLRAGLDPAGKVIAFSCLSKSFSRADIASNESDPRDSLAGQLMGMGTSTKDTYFMPGENVPSDSYSFPNRLVSWETIAPLRDGGSPLRTTHLRDPLGPEGTFANESFIDELAVATGRDPVAFRLDYLKDPRESAVVKAAAEKAGWESRVSGPRGAPGDLAAGRGIAFARRHKTMVAVVAAVEVERSTGKVRLRRLTVAHDCGLIVNPDGLRQCIENQVVYSSSRALWEEVSFDREKVTSVDWQTYPILDIAEAPDAVEIVLINRPEQAPTGAGEPATRPIAAAIANAIYDATGVRLRRAPFKPDWVKASFA
ncbi:MAG TPA: molybdopterin cofactor-binding domain-containing protein, partial [Stellaceae bacterium]|nr:molybdopterin cofactor-binding domain-containing protein [Stellaceae bacterium]